LASRRAVLERRRAAQARQRKLIQTSAITILSVALIIVIVYVATTTLKIGRGTPTPDLILTAIAQSTANTAAAAQTTGTPAGGTSGSNPAVGGATPALVGTRTYASAPPMLIDTTKKYTATVTMAKGGQIVIQLYPDKAPITVNSFVFLARQGFFNGLTFHRVLAGFMAQGGDPTGTGSGGPGYQFVNENSDLKFDKAGVVAMANAGPNTNGSQFFITFAPYPTGDGSFTIFGQVTSGMDVVTGITLRDPQTNPTFTGDVIQSITITEQ
jgi:cyclophilin family peptidyl-prolyl cis-trans isomerase